MRCLKWSVLIVPALFAAALAVAPGCDITDATLTWGFTGSTSDGATSTTPSFQWSGGAGRYDPATGTGYIDFTGSVRFTGHDGLLDTTIRDPTLLLQGASGTMLLDVTGVTMDGDVVDSTDVAFVDLLSIEVVGDDAVRTLDAETALTDDGAVAFPDYAVGEAFDPVSVSMTVGKTCSTERADDVSDDGNPALIGPLAGGVAVALAAGVGIFVATRRRGA